MATTLTEKQQRFAEEYAVDLDKVAAYRRAGYRPRADEAARTAASRLLRNGTVWAAVAAALKARGERVAVAADDVLRGLLREARGAGVPDTRASARVAAWALVGKHLGLFPDRLKVEGTMRLTPSADDLAAADRELAEYERQHGERDGEAAPQS